MLLPPPAPVLPCPLGAGWELVAQADLPRTDAAGRPQGGFSAAAVDENQTLWLLSDAPQGRLQRWRGLEALGQKPLREAGSLPLAGRAAQPLPAAIDAEALVLRGAEAWVASEGRRQRDQQAALLVFGRADGTLRASLPLPDDWLERPGQGLPANGGPESLALLPGLDAEAPGPPVLVVGAELPLLQDPPDRVRLAALRLPPPGAAASLPARTPAWIPLPSLRLPGEGWGLTDLLPLPPDTPGGAGALLALFRRFEPPQQWQVNLALFPLPTAATPASAPLDPLVQWDLLRIGLPPDNWEAMAWLRPRPGGPPRLLLGSDDNFNPMQANRLAVLRPLPSPSCPLRP